MKKRYLLLPLIVFLFSSCNTNKENNLTPRLKVSENHGSLPQKVMIPFSQLGIPGWLLFMKLTREETENYLETRRLQGFNVIQVMVLHDVRNAVNAYEDSAILTHRWISRSSHRAAHLMIRCSMISGIMPIRVIDVASSKGIYMALVPVWGSNVRAGKYLQPNGRKIW